MSSAFTFLQLPVSLSVLNSVLELAAVLGVYHVTLVTGTAGIKISQHRGQSMRVALQWSPLDTQHR